MCGRFTLIQTAEAIEDIFDIENTLDLEPQYNIAPTQMVVAVLHPSESDERMLQHLRWGLIPGWAKDGSIGSKLINARAETIAEKPSFRLAFKRRRCLVVADGFYEWQRQDSKKQPFYFHLQDKKPFGFAGLWEQWQSKDGETIASCTIITTEANELMQPIHDRMPVILKQEDYDLWLDPEVQTPGKLQPLLQPYPTEAMAVYPVSTIVNSPRNNTPECLIGV